MICKNGLNTELLASIADLARVSPPSHAADLLTAARDEIARLNSENARLQATVAIQARRAPLSAEERRALVTALRVGAKDGIVDLPPLKVGKVAVKLEGGRRL